MSAVDEVTRIVELPPDSGVRLPLSDRIARPLNDRTDDEGRAFNSSRPWIGNAQPPDDWDPRTLSGAVPDVTLQLDYVYGYRSRVAHNNLHWIDEPNVILYHAAAVGVVCDVVSRSQRHYLGHTDDILCLDYCPRKRLAASGGLGKNNTAPIMIWSVDDMSTKLCIKGTLQYGVLAVTFSADGSRIFGVGSDTSHSVALFDAVSGLVLSTISGDKNRIAHCIADTTVSRDSKRNFITVGVSHIKFWQKVKGDAPMVGKKAIGGDISKQTMVCAACTLQHVVVGNVSGGIYIFTDQTLVRSHQAHANYCGALTAVHNHFYSGGRDGTVKMWNLELPDPVLVQTYELDHMSYLSANEVMVEGKKKQRHNGARALSVVNGKVLVGTQLGSIYIVHDPANVTAVLETHFEDVPGTMPELWGLDVHPREPLFCTSAEDSTLRLWSLELGSMILMTNVTFPSRACAFSPDGSMIAVGHENGCFSVWDGMMLTPIVPFTRKREHRVQAIAFSPDGRFLAMSMDIGHVIDVYAVKRDFAYVGYCDGFSSNFRQLDWGLASNAIQACTTSYENVCFNIPECTINQSAEMSNEKWASHSCFIGWGVQGIWEDCSDGTDINCCARSNNHQLLAVGYDSSEVRLYRYPCLPKTIENSAKVIYPEGRRFTGHSSHVTNAKWSADDRYLVTMGGMDLTVLRWKVVPVGAPQPPEPPKASVADSVAQGIIRELGHSLKKTVWVDDQAGAAQPSPQPPGAMPPPSANDGSASLGATVRSASASGRTSTLRRPFSSNAGVRSRLLEPTASMQEKSRQGREQREHVLKQQAAKKRFSNF